MSERKSYFELLKHPKWQARRLEVMGRAGFACEWCGDEDETLHVHHTYYRKGAKPWEYPDSMLVCLCANCHEEAEYQKDRLNRSLGILARHPEMIDRIIGYAMGVKGELCEGQEYPLELDTRGIRTGIADYFGMDPKYVRELNSGTDDLDGVVDWHHFNAISQAKLFPR